MGTGAYTPGAEGSGRSEGMEPPWKSLSVMVLPLKAFFFDILSLSLSPAPRYRASLTSVGALAGVCVISAGDGSLGLLSDIGQYRYRGRQRALHGGERLCGEKWQREERIRSWASSFVCSISFCAHTDFINYNKVPKKE